MNNRKGGRFARAGARRLDSIQRDTAAESRAICKLFSENAAVMMGRCGIASRRCLLPMSRAHHTMGLWGAMTCQLAPIEATPTTD
jgi:hypothetical protein